MRSYVTSGIRRTELSKSPRVLYHPSRPYSQGKADFTRLDPDDPRPPWFYSASLLLRTTLIPIAFVYGIFFYDFGDREHVFMPARRWLERRKQAFFALSPAEREMVERSRREAEELRDAETAKGQ